MNTTSSTHVNCYEVSEQGIRAVRVPAIDYVVEDNLFACLFDARATFMLRYREQKPRVAPRMSTDSPSVVAQEVAHAHA